MVKEPTPMGMSPQYSVVMRPLEDNRGRTLKTVAYYAKKRYLGFLWLYISGDPHRDSIGALKEIFEYQRRKPARGTVLRLAPMKSGRMVDTDRDDWVDEPEFDPSTSAPPPPSKR